MTTHATNRIFIGAMLAGLLALGGTAQAQGVGVGVGVNADVKASGSTGATPQGGAAGARTQTGA